jgi:hypothetical protein
MRRCAHAQHGRLCAGRAGLALRPNLKVILMTGYAQTPPKLVDAQEIGTLRKPFDIDVLCRRAEDLLH